MTTAIVETSATSRLRRWLLVTASAVFSDGVGAVLLSRTHSTFSGASQRPGHRVLIVTVATNRGARYEMPGAPGPPVTYVNVGAGEEWHGMRTKTDTLFRWLQNATLQMPDQLAILADGGDVLFGGCSEDDLIGRYQALIRASGGARVVAGAELTLFPFFKGQHTVCQYNTRRRVEMLAALGSKERNPYSLIALASRQPFIPNCAVLPSYQFANGGFLMGPISALREVQAGMAAAWDEQAGLHKYALEHPDQVVLDYEGSIVLNSLRWVRSVLVKEDGGAVRNRVTDTVQCFLHGNGGYFKNGTGGSGNAWRDLVALVTGNSSNSSGNLETSPR